MFDIVRARLDALATVGERALPRAAARIDAQLRTDATTKRGNVPAGIEVRSTDSSVAVAAPAWVMKRVGNADAWAKIVVEEIDAEARR